MKKFTSKLDAKSIKNPNSPELTKAFKQGVEELKSALKAEIAKELSKLGIKGTRVNIKESKITTALKTQKGVNQAWWSNKDILLTFKFKANFSSDEEAKNITRKFISFANSYKFNHPLLTRFRIIDANNWDTTKNEGCFQLRVAGNSKRVDSYGNDHIPYTGQFDW